MEAGEEFPFGTGQRVESKSNIKGFRGAWFRSEIKYIQIRRGEIWCAMHYMDFPDEKTNFMKAYQHDVSGKKKRVLMVRPLYPLVCMGNNESAINAATGSVVVVNGDWWVGDLVDWFTDGCFWAARIIAVLSKDSVKVELPTAPIGEGGCYEAAVKDIRPSLDWSMEQLWTVPSAKSLQSRASIQKMDESSSLSFSPINASGILDKDHIFIAKQEPARTTVVQGFDNTLTSREEAQMKRKFSCLLPQKNKVSDGRPSNTSLKASGPFSMRAVKGSAVVNPLTQVMGVYSGTTDAFPMHIKPLQAKASPSDLAGKLGSEASFHRTQEQGHDVEAEAQRFVPQIDATVNAIVAKQHILGSPNTLNDSGKASLWEEFNALLEEGKCLDLSDERTCSSIVALEELVSRVAWLKGVVQLGLKGWCREIKKKKWVLCEREVPPLNTPHQRQHLITHNSGPGPANSQASAPAQAQPCLFAFLNSG